MNDENDYLMMSGLQHFAFCRRQWALIHIEQQWKENVHTVLGSLDHARCHDGSIREKRGDIMIVRGLKVISHELQMTGICDVVEFHRDQNGINIQNCSGTWKPFLVEYKHGYLKLNDADKMQLCAQVMGLEEMLSCQINEAALYHTEEHRRENVTITEELRNKTKSAAEEMWQYSQRGYTPKVKTGKQCRSCSLKDMCLPKLCQNVKVSAYIDSAINEL